MQYFIPLASKHKEISDIIKTLNKEKTSSDICYELYEEYEKNPSNDLKDKLRIAYENVPEHLRMYILGSMDEKDYPIAEIIYDIDDETI